MKHIFLIGSSISAMVITYANMFLARFLIMKIYNYRIEGLGAQLYLYGSVLVTLLVFFVMMLLMSSRFPLYKRIIISLLLIFMFSLASPFVAFYVDEIEGYYYIPKGYNVEVKPSNELIKMVSSPNEELRGAARNELIKRARNIPDLLHALIDDIKKRKPQNYYGDYDCFQAIQELSKMKDPFVKPILYEMLKSDISLSTTREIDGKEVRVKEYLNRPDAKELLERDFNIKVEVPLYEKE